VPGPVGTDGIFRPLRLPATVGCVGRFFFSRSAGMASADRHRLSVGLELYRTKGIRLFNKQSIPTAETGAHGM